MRPFVTSLLCLLAGAVAVIVGYGATWVVATTPVFAGTSHGQMTTELALSGRDLAPLGSAAGWVALAGVAGLLATRSWGRRVVGAIVALAGGVAGTVALTFALTGHAFVEATLTARGLSAPSSVAGTAWWVVGAIGGLVVLAAGAAALVRGPSWPGLSGRYERNHAAAEASVDRPVGGIAAWDAIDRGEDPTDPRSPAG